jgi:glycosyltransferase involved in cell wall biosynthesis
VRAASTKISVLHVGPGFDQRGGVASVIDELRRAEPLFKRNAISVDFFETRGFKGVTNKILFFIVDIPRFILRLLHGVDVVHFHVAAHGSAFRKMVLGHVARALRRRTVFHWHASDLTGFIRESNLCFRYGLLKFIALSNDAIGVSRAVADQIKPFRRGAMVRVIGNCSVQAERIALLGPARAPGERAADPYIAFSGRLVAQKGLSELLSAVAILKGKQKFVRVKFAGTGDVQRWIRLAEELQVTDRISFEGWLGGDDLMNFYRNARLFCLPSYGESFGIASLEAMLCGLAVVGTRTGGFFDLVKEEVTGYLTTAGDAEQLALMIEGLMADPGRAWEMGEAGRQYGLAHYSFERICAEYVQCYRNLR